ncbi:class I SAM-dependent methyltransferase [Nonomuraea sp. NPDC050556]|uniref:class I SAM-dependent methyltransferase n=1 Tax=Nonomuraea sp. NPDC050556 TaxID=3364369 RepID=UPI0037A806E7
MKIVVTGLTDDVSWTLFGTLYLRAWESRSERSILRDHYAAEAVEKLDYDFAAVHRRVRPSSNQYLVALRATRFDEWARAFLEGHPAATVLHLGCGLDSRALRLEPPPGVRWYDVDMPEVIALRAQLYPASGDYHLIGTSVTDQDWLDQIPADRPVLVVAEGLLPYLPEAEVMALLRRLTERFPSGEMIFDVSAPWLARLIKVFRWGVRDGRVFEQWNPRLTCVDQVSFGAGYAKLPAGFYRRLYQLGDAIPVWRNMFRIYRLRW